MYFSTITKDILVIPERSFYSSNLWDYFFVKITLKKKTDHSGRDCAKKQWEEEEELSVWRRL